MGFRNPLTSLSGDQITAGTIVGSTLATGTTGRRVIISADPQHAGQILLDTGDPAESVPGQVYADVLGSGGAAQGEIRLSSPIIDAGGSQLDPAAIILRSDSGDGFTAASIVLDADVVVSGGLSTGRPLTLPVQVAVSTATGAASSAGADIWNTGASLTLGAGTWLVHAAIALRASVQDQAAAGIRNLTAGSVIAGSVGTPETVPADTRIVSLFSAPTVVVLATTSELVPNAHPNGGSQLVMSTTAAAGGLTGWLSAQRIG